MVFPPTRGYQRDPAASEGTADSRAGGDVAAARRPAADGLLARPILQAAARQPEEGLNRIPLHLPTYLRSRLRARLRARLRKKFGRAAREKTALATTVDGWHRPQQLRARIPLIRVVALSRLIRHRTGTVDILLKLGLVRGGLEGLVPIRTPMVSQVDI